MLDQFDSEYESFKELAHRLNEKGTFDNRSELEMKFDGSLVSRTLPLQPHHHLAVYGTLVPGRSNHHLLATIRGRWVMGAVRGVYAEQGWGMTEGYPAMKWLPGGHQRITVHVLVSKFLEENWTFLDDFEGPDYQRIIVPVMMDYNQYVLANIYALRESNGI